MASLLLVGPAGVAGFVSILASSTTRWELATMVSFIGVVGSLFGNGLTAHLIGLVATLLACAAAVWLGMRVRRDPSRLDTALVGAVVLSLVASPHAYPDDLVMLAPAFVIGLAAAAARMGAAAPLALASPVAYAYGAWALITVAAMRRPDRRGEVPSRAARRVGARPRRACSRASPRAGMASLAGVPSLRVATLRSRPDS